MWLEFTLFWVAVVSWIICMIAVFFKKSTMSVVFSTISTASIFGFLWEFHKNVLEFAVGIVGILHQLGVV